MSTCIQNFNMHVNKKYMSTYKRMHVNMHSKSNMHVKEKSHVECVCCLLVLDSVTSTPQWIRQPKPCDVVHDVCVLVCECV
jgi:hypothetical protein